jgi:hypothetical protein
MPGNCTVDVKKTQKPRKPTGVSTRSGSLSNTMYRIPLQLSTQREAELVQNQLGRLFGDQFKQRSRVPVFDDSVELTTPDEIDTEKGLCTPPVRSSEDSLGGVLAFRKGGPFALAGFWTDKDGEIAYRLGGYAGWDKYGNKDNLHRYFEAFDTVLSELGVLFPAYRLTCECGVEMRVRGGGVKIREAYQKHKANGHDESPRLLPPTIDGLTQAELESAAAAGRCDDTHQIA